MDNKRNRRVKILLEDFHQNTIYLYGAGKRGKVALDNLNYMGMGNAVGGFLDDNYNLKDNYCGLCVYPLAQVQYFNEKNSVYIITTYAINRMACRLMEYGVAAEKIYYIPELLVDNYTLEIFRNNRDKITQVYEMLADSLSKYIYKSIYDIYINGNVGVYSRTIGSTQYFPIEGTPDAIKCFYLSDEESFVDCGAYNGDTIQEFKNKTRDKYKRVWAFEPDSDNYNRLSAYLDICQDKRIRTYNAGVYDRDAKLSFKSNMGTSSSVSENGTECIDVYRLDSIIDEKVTYIKMDIEGSEKEALLGAKNILMKYKPKLAICVYHQVEDLWMIPLLIKSLNPNYQIYIRNYEDRIDETVCYAI